MFLFSMDGEDFDVKFAKSTVIVMNIYYLWIFYWVNVHVYSIERMHE